MGYLHQTGRINTENAFLQAPAGVADPEAKRKAIGQTFINVFEQEAHKIRNIKWLGQGTIYSDVIESADSRFKKAHTIKSHHNVGGLPEKMALKLVEPLRGLFIDELRQADLYHQVDQALTLYLPVKSVGVVGDTRRYADIISLRAVTTTDFMTAELRRAPTRLPQQILYPYHQRTQRHFPGCLRHIQQTTSHD